MLIFVYGILRKGSDNNFLVNNSKYLGTYKTKNKFYMYKSNNLCYPLVLTKNINNGTDNHIVGDLYDIDSNTFKKLAAYTDNNTYYLNKVELINENETIFAHFYLLNNENNIIKLFNEKYINLINIPSGDWFNK